MALPIVVLISGHGSNLRAIAEAIDEGRCDAVIRAVISDRESAQGLAFARGRGVMTHVVKLKDYADRDQWDAALAGAVSTYEPALVVLAGFMRLVGPAMLARFKGRIVNVHPALLPLFPGKDGPAQAVRAGVRVSGCTVHVVDAGVDTGPIVAQAAVPVLPDDDAERLHQRIQRVEHRLLPAVIDAVARGAIELGDEIRIAALCFDSDAGLVSPALDRGRT
jgi:phosphoribosylglycinamide formyltransferase 1